MFLKKIEQPLLIFTWSYLDPFFWAFLFFMNMTKETFIETHEFLYFYNETSINFQNKYLSATKLQLWLETKCKRNTWRNTKFSIKIRIFIPSTRLNSGKFRWRFNLQQFCNDAENCFRNLKCLDVETWTYGYLLIQILKAKLPDDLILLISRKSEGNIWTLDKLLKFISDELIAKETCGSILNSKTNSIDNS